MTISQGEDACAKPAIPVSASLTVQSRRAASASCAARLGLMGRRLAKYSPEIRDLRRGGEPHRGVGPSGRGEEQRSGQPPVQDNRVAGRRHGGELE